MAESTCVVTLADNSQCPNPVLVKGKGWCRNCYYWSKRNGNADPNGRESRVPLTGTCSVVFADGTACTRPRRHTRGWCEICAQWSRKNGKDPNGRPRRQPSDGRCVVIEDGERCTRKRRKESRMCQMHFSRKERHGDPGAKSRRSPGEIQALLRWAGNAETDECILLDWGGERRPVVKLQGRSINASRAAWILANDGEDPVDAFVLHTCHQGGCVNIRHLYLGDHEQNMRDMVEAGREANGEANGNAELTDDQVLEVRRRYKPRDAFGNSGRALAAEFGVSPMTVSRIVNGQTWKRTTSGRYAGSTVR